MPEAKLDVIPGGNLEMTDLSMCSDYVKAFQDSGIPLDVLVLNAGMVAGPLGRTAQGHELMFGVNHLAHFLMQDGMGLHSSTSQLILSRLWHSKLPLND